MGDNSSLPEPLTVQSSGKWLGNDGSWSTFYVNVGTPPQYFHVLPSFDGQTVYVPISDDCTRLSVTDCGASRGVEIFRSKLSPGFQKNASNTWSEIGIYELDIGKRFGSDDNALYGYDTAGVSLTNGDADNVTLDHQALSAYATPDSWLGRLGLSPSSITINDTEKSRSLLRAMKDENLIPSLSFGYQAGAAYRYTKVPGSLVLGGYDQSRRSNETIMIPSSTDLLVGLQSIAVTTRNSVTTTINTGILTVIDTAVPELWLPASVCDQIASALNLTYHEGSKRYALTTAAHSALQTLNPTFRFEIGSDVRNDSAITIEIPYAAFDLEASYPLFASATKYFPLRRAANSSQYALGRVFMQEIYMVVDWERDVFNISQAVFSAPMPEPDVVPIQPKVLPTGSLESSSGGNLSAGTIAGIAIGVVLLSGVVIFGLWIWGRKQRREKAARYPGALQAIHEAEGAEKKELPEMGRGNRRSADVELEGDQRHVVELHAPLKTHELSDGPEEGFERTVVHEMPDTSSNRR